MAEIEIEIQGASGLEHRLEAAPATMEAVLVRGMQRSTLLVEAFAKRLVHRRTGRLFSSISGNVEALGPEVIGRVGTNVSYAPDVEYGTSPHEIRAAPGHALFWRGAAHPVRVVHHPGNRPYPFMHPAAIEAQPVIKSYFEVGADEVARSVAG